ncbi:hypothetical protein GCM10027288_49090 [Bordetella tumbae]
MLVFRRQITSTRRIAEGCVTALPTLSTLSLSVVVRIVNVSARFASRVGSKHTPTGTNVVVLVRLLWLPLRSLLVLPE